MDRTTLKQWFSKGKKPLASHFAAWIDSFWHKDEKIPISSVENLSSELLGKISENDTRELLSGKADNNHIHSFSDIYDAKLANLDIFDKAESAETSVWSQGINVVPDSIRLHLNGASVYLLNDYDNSATLLYCLESCISITESGKYGLKLDMKTLLSTGRFELRFSLSSISNIIKPYIKRVIFKHKYQVPRIFGNLTRDAKVEFNFIETEADSMFLVKDSYSKTKRLCTRQPNEQGLLDDIYYNGTKYGDNRIYYNDSLTSVPAITGYMYSTPYFMHASNHEFGKRDYLYYTESVFGLFPYCVLQSAYIKDGCFSMVFIRPHTFKDKVLNEEGFPLDVIIPDVYFDLILDKKGIEENMKNQ